jgi:bacterioferritin
MQGNPQVIEYLNRALKHELAAVNQYWLHYRLLENWGYVKLAKHERAESIEEMQHADRLVERIIFLDGQPKMQTLDPLHIGQEIKSVIENDLKAEQSARQLYMEAREVCRKSEDYVSMNLFEDLLRDEEDHIDFLETQLQLMGKIGVENYGLLQAEAATNGENKD